MTPARTSPPVRIGITGTHSTGKTLLLKRIEMELRSHGVAVARTGRLAKRAAALGFPKMHHHTAASTEWIICQGVADTLAAEAQGADVVLIDRAPIDALAYYGAALEFRNEAADPLEHERLQLLAATQHPTFALLLATVLDPDIPASATDGHPYDPHYRTLVDTHIRTLLAEDHLDHVRVTSTPSSIDAAIAWAVSLCLEAIAP
ncbi:AAA family ATPase [Streptomyces sp. NBC_01198]|uniref:AAA family ATPase n=1 Tax=Streptomyces sp. NBC_01198 TaxID=2903769 RepID=UPI002E123BBC|nr:ATP-binding protein [Streptomyces sp. NBC_01198]